MKINLTVGIDQLQFGMLQSDVEKIYGKPNKQYNDEDDNVIYLYDEPKFRLTFYEEEDFKLGFIISAHKDLEIAGFNVIGKSFEEAKTFLATQKITEFTEETFDTYLNFFNEDNWLILQTEFGEIVKVELGATFNAQDEFDWKYKK